MSNPQSAPATNPTETPAMRLHRRSFNTYTARLKARERLASRNHAWNASLVALTTSATIASVGMLTDSKMYGDNGDTLLVCVSILTLVASLVTSGLDYSGRTRDMFVNYRRVQRLSVKAEAAETDAAIDVGELESEYDALMDESENHTAGDFYKAERQRLKDMKRRNPELKVKVKFWPGNAIALENLLTYAPYSSLALTLGLTYPLVRSFF